MPLTRVLLYETGVSYFERSGQMTAKDSIQLPVPIGHLDDALKTLTVLDSVGKLSLQGLSFPSSMSRGMGQALAGLPLGDAGRVQFRQLLAGLKGHRVELQTTQGELRGHLLEAGTDAESDHLTEDSTVNAETLDKEKEVVLLMTAEGSIRRVPLAQISQVRPADPELKARLRSAFQALTRSAGDRRALRLLAESAGPVTLGYVAEAPLWRCSYRLVTSVGAPPTIQGWSLLHNDSDEDWRNVQVELVSGRPDSFLFPLAVPRYHHRQLVHPEQALPSVPQLLTTTTDEIWGDQLDTLSESYGAGGLGLRGTGRGGGGAGAGTIGLGSLGAVGKGETVASSDELTVGNLARFTSAAGSESGALFRYRLPQALNIAAHSSALIPFLQAPIEAERVTLLRELDGPARSALIFSNTSGQTLPAGTVSFFADGGFSGESFMERAKPGERRFLEFGTDLDVELERLEDAEHQQPRREVKKVTYRNQQLTDHFLRHQTFALVLTNRSQQPRRVLVQLKLSQNAQVDGADGLDFDAGAGHPIAIFDLDAGATAKRTLTAVEGLMEQTHWHKLSVERLQELAQLDTLPQAQRDVLTVCAGRRQELDAATAKLQLDKDAAKRLETELERLRKHLEAAGDKGGAGTPLVRRIIEAEDRYRALEKRLVAQSEALEQLRGQLKGELERLR